MRSSRSAPRPVVLGVAKEVGAGGAVVEVLVGVEGGGAAAAAPSEELGVACGVEKAGAVGAAVAEGSVAPSVKSRSKSCSMEGFWASPGPPIGTNASGGRSLGVGNEVEDDAGAAVGTPAAGVVEAAGEAVA